MKTEHTVNLIFPMARRFSRTYSNLGLLPGDFAHQAFLDIEKYKKEFHPAHIMRLARWSMINLVRYENRRKLFELEDTESKPEIPQLDILEQVNYLMKDLSSDEKALIYERFYQEKLLKEIAQPRAISEEAIRQRLKNLFLKLREKSLNS